MKCRKFPKYFKQRCYVKSFCKNSKSSDVTAVSYCWFVRLRFVKSASTDQGTPSMACCHDACCWMQTWLIASVYHICGRFWKHVRSTPRATNARHCWLRRAEHSSYSRFWTVLGSKGNCSIRKFKVSKMWLLLNLRLLE